MLDPWGVRGKKEGLLPLYKEFNDIAARETQAKVLVVPPPPIPGLGQSGGFQGVVELRDGSFDYTKLQQVSDLVNRDGNAQAGLTHLFTTYRSQAPQLLAEVDRDKARSLGRLGLGCLRYAADLSGLVLCQSVHQIRPGVSGLCAGRRQCADDAAGSGELRRIRNDQGAMVPLGTLMRLKPDFGPPIITLYNTYPSAMLNGSTAPGFSSGQAIAIVDDMVKHVLPAGFGFEWTATAYQEVLAGGATVIIFGLSLLLVYLVLAGQYESWITPISVLLAVPLALLGTVAALTALGDCQQHLHPDRPGAADRAGRQERHPGGRGGARAARGRQNHPGSRGGRRRKPGSGRF